jgi:hypothetical protein
VGEAEKDGRSCQPSTGTLDPINRYQVVKHQPGQHSQVGCRAASNLPATRLHVASGCNVSLRFRRCADQHQQQGTYGYVLRHEPPARQWHARGQGFKSPQLHQAQRIFHLRSERHLPEICQKTRSVVARTLAVLSGFGGLEGLLSEQLADRTTPRQAPMGAARWPGCGGCRTLPLDGTASRPIGTALPQASDGWSSQGDIPLLGVVKGGADGGRVVGRPSHA